MENKIYKIKYQLANGETKHLQSLYWREDVAIVRVNDISSYVTNKEACILQCNEYKPSDDGSYVWSREVYTLYWDDELNDWNER